MKFFSNEKIFKTFSILMMVFTSFAILFKSETSKIALVIALLLYIVYVIINGIVCYCERKKGKK